MDTTGTGRGAARDRLHPTKAFANKQPQIFDANLAAKLPLSAARTKDLSREVQIKELSADADLRDNQTRGRSRSIKPMASKTHVFQSGEADRDLR
jgi:hypothetical protein